MESPNRQFSSLSTLSWGLISVGVGLLVAAHYRFYHYVEWDWALWWGIKDGLLWGILAALILLASERVASPLNLGRAAFVVLTLSILAALAHSLLVVSLSYLVEGLTTERSFAQVFGHQLMKKAPLNLSIFLGITSAIFVWRSLRSSPSSEERSGASVDRLFVRYADGSEAYLRPEEIDHVEAEGNYVSIHAGDRHFLERQTMLETERLLVATSIVRVHRSHLVNLDRIEKVRATGNGNFEAILSTGAVVPVSRGYRQKLKNRLT